MERAPIPPHERSWRHPSELAASHHTANSSDHSDASASRLLAVATGAVAATLVVVLAVTVLPRREPAPVAMSATTLPPFSVSAAAQVAEPEAAASASASRGDLEQVRLERTALASPAGLALTGAPRSVAAPLVDDEPESPVATMDGEIVHLITTSHVYRLEFDDLDRIIAPDGTLVVGDGGRIVGSFVDGRFVTD